MASMGGILPKVQLWASRFGEAISHTHYSSMIEDQAI
jgi:hypothetical protein